MRLLSELSGSYASLSAVQKEKLAAYLTMRNEYLPVQAELNRRRIALLENFSVAEEKAISEYSATVVAPLRDKMTPLIRDLIKESVDVEGVQKMLPMVLMVLMQSVNLPLLLTTFALEPDTIDKIASDTSSYFRGGM